MKKSRYDEKIALRGKHCVTTTKNRVTTKKHITTKKSRYDEKTRYDGQIAVRGTQIVVTTRYVTVCRVTLRCDILALRRQNRVTTETKTLRQKKSCRYFKTTRVVTKT